jgi:hypothetical protein
MPGGHDVTRQKPAAFAPKPKGAAAIHTTLVRLSSRLDRLQSEIQLGIRDQNHFDALESEAQDIGKGLRGAFRGPGSNR